MRSRVEVKIQQQRGESLRLQLSDALDDYVYSLSKNSSAAAAPVCQMVKAMLTEVSTRRDENLKQTRASTDCNDYLIV